MIVLVCTKVARDQLDGFVKKNVIFIFWKTKDKVKISVLFTKMHYVIRVHESIILIEFLENSRCSSSATSDPHYDIPFSVGVRHKKNKLLGSVISK